MGNCLESAYKSPFSTLLVPSDLLAAWETSLKSPENTVWKKNGKVCPLIQFPSLTEAELSDFLAFEIRGTRLSPVVRLWPRVAFELTFRTSFSPRVFPICMKRDPRWISGASVAPAWTCLSSNWLYSSHQNGFMGTHCYSASWGGSQGENNEGVSILTLCKWLSWRRESKSGSPLRQAALPSLHAAMLLNGFGKNSPFRPSQTGELPILSVP